MTLDQTQFRPASAHPAHATVADTMDAAGPQVWEDVTVVVALCVGSGPRPWSTNTGNALSVLALSR